MNDQTENWLKPESWEMPDAKDAPVVTPSSSHNAGGNQE